MHQSNYGNCSRAGKGAGSVSFLDLQILNSVRYDRQLLIVQKPVDQPDIIDPVFETESYYQFFLV
jgi:hypothetical protein